jgi:hypothetical protein
MARKDKTLDAVEMTREIRSRHREQTRDMTREERIAFYRKKAQRLHQQLDDQKENQPAE